MGSTIPFGIDFGTSNIVISYYQNDKYNFVIDNTGQTLIPNVLQISNDGNEILFGNDVTNQNSNNYVTIKNIKRLIGEHLNSNFIKDNKFMYPFIEYINNQIKIRIGNNLFTIEDIVTKIFSILSKIAENYTLSPIKIAVITVPAYFSDCQRILIKNAAINAGIEVLKIINEPTSAAIATFKNTSVLDDTSCLVYDLGGGTLDITVLEYSPKLETYNVISTVGLPHLGGVDFDNKLMLYFLKIFSTKNNISLEDLVKNTSIKDRTMKESKICREYLTKESSYNIYIESLYLGYDMNITIRRSQFENICYSEFLECATLINKIVYPPNFSNDKIHTAILVGGASRMPKIKNILESKVKNAKFIDGLNPDLLVSMGAAITAHQLFIKMPILLLDVTPLAIGIETNNGIMANIIEKNEHIPLSRVKVFTTEFDNQPSFNLNIYEGDYLYAKQNNFLGTIVVNKLPLRKKGDLKIYIRFKIDNDGILTANVKYDKVKIKNTIIKIKDKNVISSYSDSFIERSLLLLKFRDYLINIKYLFEDKNISYPKVDKLLSWITSINNPDNLKIESISIQKMREHIELEVNNLISTHLIYK